MAARLLLWPVAALVAFFAMPLAHRANRILVTSIDRIS
jgi:hypothetical protein